MEENVIIDNVKRALLQFGINPSKDKGQNFLINSHTCKNIANTLNSNEKSNILEVGPGVGSLTYFLKEKPGKLTCVELDKEVFDYFKTFLPDVEIQNKNVFDFDVSSYDVIVSNIPYNITKELLEYLLLNARKCKQFIFMCQKENYQHFSSVSGSEYGPLSVLIHLLGNIKKCFNVAPTDFVPKPKCVSTVFEICVNENVKQETFDSYAFVNRCFASRRKTILNNLSMFVDKEKAIKALSETNINANRRPEEIKPEEFISLYRKIS